MKLLVTLLLVTLVTQVYSQLQCFVCDDCKDFEATATVCSDETAEDTSTEMSTSSAIDTSSETITSAPLDTSTETSTSSPIEPTTVTSTSSPIETKTETSTTSIETTPECDEDCEEQGSGSGDTEITFISYPTKIFKNNAPAIIHEEMIIENEPQPADDEINKLVQTPLTDSQIISNLSRRRREVTSEFRCYTVEILNGYRVEVNRGCVKYNTNDEVTCLMINGERPYSCDLCNVNECNSSSVIASPLVSIAFMFIISLLK